MVGGKQGKGSLDFGGCRRCAFVEVDDAGDVDAGAFECGDGAGHVVEADADCLGGMRW